MQQLGGGADAGAVRGVPLAVEVDVREQVDLSDQDQVGLPEQVLVLQRLVCALSDRGEHDPGGLTRDLYATPA